jgi:hypothetical protein
MQIYMVARRRPIRADLANLMVLFNTVKHNWPKQKMSKDNHEMLVIAGSTSEKENEQKQENN